MLHRYTVALCGLLASLVAAAQGNLLRNSDFQDDWATHLPETKNHHWNYSSEYQHRRDYNPDNWWLTGSWDWHDADAAPGARRLVLHLIGTILARGEVPMLHCFPLTHLRSG